MLSARDELVDVIIRTKNSEEFLRESVEAAIREIPIRRIIVIDGGKTLEIVSSFNKVDVYI